MIANSEPSEDLLNVEQEADALASVISARAVPTPLSVGILGRQGSGAAFFAALVSDRVARLSQTPRHPSSEVFGPVLQVEVNAWENARRSPWLAIVESIYSRIGAAVPDQSALFRAIPGGRKLTGAADAHVHAAKQVVEASRTRLDEAEEKYRSALERHARIKVARPWSEVTDRFLGIVGTSAAEIDRYGEKLGITGLSGDAEAYANLINGTKSVGGRAEILSSIRTVRRYLGTTLLVGGGTLVAAVAAYYFSGLITEIDDLKGRIDTSLKVVGGAVALLGGLAAIAAHIAQNQAARALKELEKWGGKLGQIVSDVEVANLRELMMAEQVVERLGTQMRDAATRLSAAEDAVVEAEHDLEQIRGDDLFRKILDDYSSAKEGTPHGMIPMVRADLQAISEALTYGANVAEGLPERILVHIGDLDQCGPEMVVGYLQAVQQLLSFPGIAVIVVLDPRYAARVLAPYDELEGEHGRSTASYRSRVVGYLTRLFSIYFQVARPSKRAMRYMVDAVAPETESRVAAPEPSPASGPVPAYVSDESVDEREGHGLRVDAITEAEIESLRSVGTFADTPRDVKRLVNSYRLARLMVPEHAVEAFLAGDHRAFLTLLAIVVLAPVEAPAFLDALDRDSVPRFLDQIEDAERGELDVIRGLVREFADRDGDAMAKLRQWSPLAQRFAVLPITDE